MGFNRRKTEDQRRDAAEKDAATRRATDAQVFEDAEPLSSCAYRGRASPTKCARSIGGECLANDRDRLGWGQDRGVPT